MSETDTLERPKAKDAPQASSAVTIDRDRLLAAVRTVGQVVEARNTIPILSNLLLVADADVLRISGTDLNMMVTVEAPCSTAGGLATTVAEATLKGAIDTLRPGAVELFFDDADRRLVLKQGRAIRRLPTIPADDFPPLSLDGADAEFELPAGDLLAILAPPSVSMSTEEKVRSYLCGVFLHIVDGRTLVADATDGFGMVRVQAPLPAGAANLPDVILSRKTINIVKRLLDAGERSVKVRASETKVAFAIGELTLTAKVVEGTFPDIGRVIPQANGSVLRVHGAELRRCITAAAALAQSSGSARGIRLKLSREDCQTRITSPEAAVVDPLDGDFDAEPIEVGLNSRLAIPLIQIFGDTAQLEVRLQDPATPILFTSPDKPAITAVLMTMR